MPSILFRSAVIRPADIRYDRRSKMVFTRINFSAAFSKPVRDEFGWEDLPAGFPSAKIDSVFQAKQFTLTPNGLEQHAFSLEAKDMDNFSVHRVEEDGKKPEFELRFQILSHDKRAAGSIAKYLGAVGEAEGQLKVIYEAQSELEAEAEQGKLISEEQAADTSEAADGKRGPRSKKREAPVN